MKRWCQVIYEKLRQEKVTVLQTIYQREGGLCKMYERAEMKIIMVEPEDIVTASPTEYIEDVSDVSQIEGW